MEKAGSVFVEGVVHEEVRRLVAEAITKGGTLSTGRCVAMIRKAYPNCPLSTRAMTDMVIKAASAADVAIQIDSPADGDGRA